MRTIYHNGRVYAGKGAFATAFAIEDGRFVYAGDDAGALALAAEGDRTVDLGGLFVCAGFNYSHMHLLGTGQALSRAQLDRHTASLADMIDYMRRFAEDCPSEWIVGRGWNQDKFTDTDRMPGRRDLDRVSKDRPVVAVRCCGHALAVNSEALRRLGVTADTKAPAGGAIGLENGAPDGRFYDEAMSLVYDAIPEPDLDQVRGFLEAGCAALSRCGVTSCQSDDYSAPWRLVDRAMRELADAGRLTVRVTEQCNFSTEEAFADFLEETAGFGADDDMFRHGPLKMVADGALGARTAYLSRPYADAPGTRGLCLFTQQTLDRMTDMAHAHGMPVAIHCIGDGCLDMALKAIEGALAKAPRADHRHGIVHVQITRPDQLRRMADMGVHAFAQTIFLDYDSTIVRDRVGDLADSSYSWKTLMNLGGTVSNGTDSPVERPDALRGIQCAVTRRPLAGGEAYLPHEAMTVAEALDSYTCAGAYASFEERKKGLIQAGMLADFVILGGDPFAAAPDSIAQIPVLATYLGGREVYRASDVSA